MKKIFLLIFVGSCLAACKKKEVLPSQSQLDMSDPVMNSTDRWIMDSLTTPYNIDVRYKWDEWNMPDMGKYNYPTTPGHTAVLLKVLKHTWLDAYVETAGELFIKKNSPRQFTIFGGVDLTPNGGVGAWGQASGGVNVLLFQANELDETDLFDIGSLRGYSGLMHHEFTHILNQNVPFDEENFQKITPVGYTANFHLIPENVSHEEGFITSYARMNIMEDFAEMAKIMLTHNRAQWDAFVDQEVAKYTRQRDAYVNGFEDILNERRTMRRDLANANQVIADLHPALSGFPDQFGATDQERLAAYLTDVFVPILRAVQPVMDFMYANYRSDYDGGNQTTYNLLVQIAPIWADRNFSTTPALLRRFLPMFNDGVIPYLENRFSESNDVVPLSKIITDLEKAQDGRNKIREKERFIVEYFKSKLNINLYELQAASYGKLTTPISTVAGPSGSTAKQEGSDHAAIISRREVRHYLMNSRFHVCSFEKQSRQTH